MADSDNYDVWMINARGTHSSRRHMWLDPDSDPEFWNFSFEEFGSKDLTAAVSFIQEKRGNDDKISLFGYS